MIRSFLRGMGLVILLVGSAWGQELQGAWAVEGTLPGGAAFAGYAGWTPQQVEGRYTVSVAVELEDGSTVRWQATATQAGDQVHTRHWRPGAGMSQVLGGLGGAEARVEGRYTVDGQTLRGGFGLAGQAQGQAVYTRVADPQVGFEPALPSVDVGQTAEVALRVQPAGLERLVWIEGPAQEACGWRRVDGSLVVEGRQAGAYAFRALLGRGGPTLATLGLEVRADTLDRVLALVEREANDGDGLVPLVIFDLDDTLFDTRYRTLRILHEYAEAEHQARMETAQPEQIHHGLRETLLELGYSEQEIQGGLEGDVRRFWLKRFFSDDRLEDDMAYHGAPAYLHRLVAAGAQIAYVTGRKTTALVPSRAKLEADGYPIAGQHFFFKPITKPWEPKLETSVYKGQVAAEELPKLGEVVAAFDNEPGNCNAFRQNLPGWAIVIFLDTLYPADSPAIVEGVETIRSKTYAD